MLSELDQLVTNLEREPLSQIMLGHRELFHSNMIAWFFEAFPKQADDIFGKLSYTTKSATSIRRVLRESKNLDLRFEWPDRQTLIIENKIFSTPNQNQLQQYAKKFRDQTQQPTLWLLSLADPGWPNGQFVTHNQTWRWLPLRNLGEQMFSALQNLSPNYEVETATRYAKILHWLSDLSDFASIKADDERVYMPETAEGMFKNSRLKPSIEKLRFLSLKQWIDRALVNSLASTNECNTNFTRGKSICDWFSFVTNDKSLEWGWQLQEKTLRLALRFSHNSGHHGKDKKDARINFAIENPEFFNFKKLDKVLGRCTMNPLPKSGGFNSFNPDFVYRYVKCPKITIRQLQEIALIIAHESKTYST